MPAPAAIARVRSHLHRLLQPLLLDRRNLRIFARQGFYLLEQRQMLRRDLAQLGIQILDWDFLSPRIRKEILQRGVGDAKLSGQPFISLISSDESVWPARKASMISRSCNAEIPAVQANIDRDVALRAIKDRTAWRFGPLNSRTLRSAY